MPSEEARRRLPAMLREVRRSPNAVFVIGRHRRPEAVLIPVAEYERLRATSGGQAGLSDRAREQILNLARERGARNVRVFGSVARGETDERSDLDLLVEMQAGYRLLDLSGLVAELEDALGRPVDVVPEDALRPELRERILAEAVPL